MALAETLLRYGVVVAAQGHYQESGTILEEARKVLRESGDKGDPSLEPRILLSLATNRISLGDYESGQKLSQAALASLRRLPSQAGGLATALLNLGRILDLKDRDAEAEDFFRQALSAAERMPDPNNVLVGITVNTLGALQYKRGEYAEAHKMFMRALDIERRTVGDQSAIYAVTLHNLAALASVQGRYGEALEQFAQALSILQKKFPPNHERVLTARNQLASTLVQLHEYDRAEKIFLEVLGEERKAHPLGHPALAGTLNNLAYLYQDEGRLQEANKLYEESLGIFTRLIGRKSRPVATLLGNLGAIALGRGDTSAAERRFKEALDISRGISAGRTPDAIIAKINLASLYVSTGRLNKASPLVDENTRLASEVVGPDGLLMGQVRLLKARLLLAQGDIAGALLEVRQARAILSAKLPAGDWRIASTGSVLGAALGKAGTTGDAEKLLLNSLSQLCRIKGARSLHAREARKRVYVFYHDLGRDREAARYQSKKLYQCKPLSGGIG